MQARDFAFWLQGFFELNAGSPAITPEQAKMIKTHLALVFKHDPTMEHDAPAESDKHSAPFKPVRPKRFETRRDAVFC